MFVAADTAVLPIQIKRGPARRLTERLLSRDSRRTCLEEGVDGFVIVTHHIPTIEGFLERWTVNRWYVCMQESSPIQFTKNSRDTTRPMHIFHMILGRIRCDLAELGHLAREAIDVSHGEVDTCFLSRRQQVQNRVGGTTHRDIEHHGILKRLEA